MAEALVRIPGVMFAVDSHAKYYMIARVGHEIFKHVKPGTPVTVTELDRTGDDRKFRISYETDSEGESQNSV